MLPANLGWSSLVILAIRLLSMHSLWASAQQTTVVCLSQYDWMDNSKGQNPCLVAAFLRSVCGGPWTIAPLPPNYYYPGPIVDTANPCECNSVTYSLMAACSTCQNLSFATWTWWTTNCSTVFPGVYPKDIPSGIAIPHWAYQDVSSDLFNVTLAQLAGDAPEASATKQSTATAVTSTTLPASITSAAETGTSSTQTSSTSSSKSNTGAIVGGAVGGVVAFDKGAMYDGAAPTNGVYTAMNSFAPPTTQSKPYDPSDPSTFPPLPTTHTNPATGYPNNSIQSSIYASKGGRPTNGGVPEL